MNDLKNRTLTIEKNFNAPLQLVWDAWTQSEHIVKWWAPKGIDIKVIEHNFKVDGKWKYSALMHDGNEYITEGTYTEIVKLKKIVTSADFKPMTENVEIQVYFEADGEKTKFTFSVIHATQEYCKQQEELGFYNGWGSVLNRLDEFLNNNK
jgi:uncharacterized protein YndB with AHSA1/START domain